LWSLDLDRALACMTASFCLSLTELITLASLYPLFTLLVNSEFRSHQQTFLIYMCRQLRIPLVKDDKFFYPFTAPLNNIL
jgi:hypothetical protein